MKLLIKLLKINLIAVFLMFSVKTECQILRNIGITAAINKSSIKCKNDLFGGGN